MPFPSLNKRENKNNYSMYQIKPEYHYRDAKKTEVRDFIFMQAGRRIKVNFLNLNEERAHLMLASKYAHVIEGQPDFVEKEKGVKSPNVSEVATASTSTEAKAGVTIVREKGKKKLSKSPS